VDAAMVDGAASLVTMTYSFKQLGLRNDQRGANMLDTGAPYYEVYDTSDGKWFAVGAIEAQFYAELVRVLGLEDEDLPPQNDRSQWAATKERFAAVFRSHTRDEWTELFEGTDACGAPVLSPWEAHLHPHNRARDTFIEVDGVVQPGPVPRFSRTPATVSCPPTTSGLHGDETLADWGVDRERIASLRQSGAID
ncbi:MAG TPA: CoA transferase, partial [Acidimicrobiales bacterium]|nr:CoA transferase [Acidimicrobiales bacterium]